jgi:hypothetical protein
MSRSLKKGPFIEPKLLKKVEVMNTRNDKVIRTWSRASTISLRWLDIRSPYTMVAGMFLFTSPRIWLDIA